ncbi:MAG: hypothetical protein LIO46_02215 [Clostridiales bacterium]|nr:hypothetical protein [Clostridiales bacterium]
MKRLFAGILSCVMLFSMAAPALATAQPEEEETPEAYAVLTKASGAVLELEADADVQLEDGDNLTLYYEEIAPTALGPSLSCAINISKSGTRLYYSATLTAGSSANTTGFTSAVVQRYVGSTWNSYSTHSAQSSSGTSHSFTGNVNGISGYKFRFVVYGYAKNSLLTNSVTFISGTITV